MPNTFLYFWIKILTINFLSWIIAGSAAAQTPRDTTAPSPWLQRRAPDSTLQLNMDATYNRPFLQANKLPIALGGYLEANTNWVSEDGVSEGLSFQVPRVTLFASSTIARGLRFLAEIEFEEGGREINLEFASLDLQFHPALNLRGGVVLNPIGAFNQNHDGPKWAFVSRPVSATQMLPATWSNAGFGLHGKFYSGAWTFGYEVYLTNGFDASIIENAEGRTFLPAAKENAERFEESFNGRPLLTAKTAFRHQRWGEIGLSYMGGAYNKFQQDGLRLDDKRRAHVIAADFATRIPGLKTSVLGEWAWVLVALPADYAPQFGERQHGGFVDVVQPFFTGKIFAWQRAVFSAALRLEYVDWNVGTFRETGRGIGDELRAATLGVGFRPTAQVVLRLNYRYQRQRDLFGNPPARSAVWQFGLSTYF